MFQFPAGSIWSESTYAALTNLTVRMILKHPSSVTTGDIFRIPCVSSDDYDFTIRYGTNTIQLETTADRHEDPWVFSFPVTANAWDDIAIAMNPNSSGTPVVYKNGVAQTVTTVSSGTVAGVMDTAVWYVGEGTTGIGYVGGLAVYNTQLSAANLEKLTRARIYDMPLWISPANLVEYVPMDDFPVGEYTAVGTNVLPDGDIANTFSSGTYSNLRTDDSSYLVANKSDDAETYTCSFETFTIPSGYSVFSFTTTLNGNTDDTAQATHYLTLGSGTNLSSSSTTFTSSDSNSIAIVYSAAAQSDIDGLKGNLVTPTMGKDDELHFDLYQVKVGYRKHAARSRSGVGWRSLPSCVLSVGLAGSGGY